MSGARARLGSESELASAMLEQKHLRSITACVPWAVFLLLPPVAGIAGAFALIAPLVLVANIRRMTSPMGLHAPMWFQHWAAWMTMFGNLALAPCLAMAFILVAMRQRMAAIWAVSAVCVLALLDIPVRGTVPAGGSDGRHTFDRGGGLADSSWQYGQPLAVGAGAIGPDVDAPSVPAQDARPQRLMPRGLWRSRAGGAALALLVQITFLLLVLLTPAHRTRPVMEKETLLLLPPLAAPKPPVTIDARAPSSLSTAPGPSCQPPLESAPPVITAPLAPPSGIAGFGRSSCSAAHQRTGGETSRPTRAPIAPSPAKVWRSTSHPTCSILPSRMPRTRHFGRNNTPRITMCLRSVRPATHRSAFVYWNTPSPRTGGAPMLGKRSKTKKRRDFRSPNARYPISARGETRRSCRHPCAANRRWHCCAAAPPCRPRPGRRTAA